jgi:hypothetical protein
MANPNHRLTGPTISTIPCRMKIFNQSIIELRETLDTDQLLRLQYAVVGIPQIQGWIKINPLIDTLSVFRNNKSYIPLDSKLVAEMVTDSNQIQSSFPISLEVVVQADNMFAANFKTVRKSFNSVSLESIASVYNIITSQLASQCLVLVQNSYLYK